MKEINFEELLKSNYRDQFLINGKYNWEFLDEYTFSDFIKDDASPSRSCCADGNISFGNEKYIALIMITKHDDRKIESGVLYWKNMKDKNWKNMVNIIKLEK